MKAVGRFWAHFTPLSNGMIHRSLKNFQKLCHVNNVIMGSRDQMIFGKMRPDKFLQLGGIHIVRMRHFSHF